MPHIINFSRRSCDDVGLKVFREPVFSSVSLIAQSLTHRHPSRERHGQRLFVWWRWVEILRLGFQVLSLRIWVSGFGLWVSDFGFGVSGFGV